MTYTAKAKFEEYVFEVEASTEEEAQIKARIQCDNHVEDMQFWGELPIIEVKKKTP